MSTRPYATTNARLAEALEIVEELIGWADADAQHASENDAPTTARDDKQRARNLRRAYVLIEASKRE